MRKPIRNIALLVCWPCFYCVWFVWMVFDGHSCLFFFFGLLSDKLAAEKEKQNIGYKIDDLRRQTGDSLAVFGAHTSAVCAFVCLLVFFLFVCLWVFCLFAHFLVFHGLDSVSVVLGCCCCCLVCECFAFCFFFSMLIEFYADSAQQVRKMIDGFDKARKFKVKPMGPLGAFIKVKDPDFRMCDFLLLIVLVGTVFTVLLDTPTGCQIERCFSKRILTAYVVGSWQDKAVLDRIFTECKVATPRPMIIVQDPAEPRLVVVWGVLFCFVLFFVCFVFFFVPLQAMSKTKNTQTTVWFLLLLLVCCCLHSFVFLAYCSVGLFVNCAMERQICVATLSSRLPHSVQHNRSH